MTTVLTDGQVELRADTDDALVIGPGTSYRFKTDWINWWTAPAVRTSDVDRGGVDGLLAGRDLLGVHATTIVVQILADDPEDLGDKVDAWKAACAVSADEDIVVRANLLGRTRRRIGRFRVPGEIMLRGRMSVAGQVADGSCLFEALDPITYGDTETSAVTTREVAGTGFSVPFVVEDGYVDLDGSSGYVSTPDSAAVSVTGDLDLRIRYSAPDWTPASKWTIASKYGSAGQLSWRFEHTTGGALEFRNSADGSTEIFHQSTTSLPFTDGSTYWVRVTLDVDNGASGHDVKFYWAADSETEPSSWTQLGSTVTTAGVTSIFDSNALLVVGARGAGSTPMPGDVRRFLVRNGLGGTVVADFDPYADATAGASTFVSSATGETWTLNGTAAFRPPFSLGASSGGGLSVTNQGNRAAPWTARLDGPLTYPEITHTQTGKRLYLSFDANGGVDLAAGQTLILDSKTRSVLLGGTADQRSKLTIDSEWWDLPPGQNDFTFRADDGTGTLTVTARDAWHS